MPVRNSHVMVTVLIVCLACYFKAQRMKQAGPLGDAIALINNHYVDPIEHRDLIDAAMKGVVSKLDPYSQFIDPGSYGHFQDALQQRFAGIGIIVEQPDKSDRVRVVTPLFATPAFKAGLRPGDMIMNVDGKSTEGLEIGKVSELLRGPEGTLVKIAVQRGEKILTMEVQRAWIPLESVLGDYRDADNRWVYRLRDHPRIAYMRINTFGEQTVDELTAALEQLDNDFDSLIIDLRQNLGGLLSAAVDIADMFLESGVIVSTRGRGGKLESEFLASEGTLIADDKPIVIMIDAESASASEIVAASLKDNQRAVVAGERSFGKGTVQNVLPLESGRSALKLTTARYYRPNGQNIHRLEGSTEEDPWGVQPSAGLEVKLSDEQRLTAMRRLQRAAYPIMPEREDASIGSTPEPTKGETPAEINQETGDQTEQTNETDTAQQVDPDAIEQDPQLIRVIEFLRPETAETEKIAA